MYRQLLESIFLVDESTVNYLSRYSDGGRTGLRVKNLRLALASRGNYSYVRNVRYQSDLFPGPVCPPFATLSLAEKHAQFLSINHHAPYLGRSKDVLDLRGAKFVRKKSMRHFVEALSSDPENSTFDKNSRFRLRIFFQKVFLKL